MKAITVCVGYDDLLAITLPRFCRAFDEVLVVSDCRDERTAAVVRSTHVPGEPVKCRLFQTDDFYENGATFNKGLAIEGAFDVVGRAGWLAVVDADIVLPKFAGEFFRDYFEPTKGGKLYVPPRRVLADPAEFRDDLDWGKLPQAGDREHAGYCQIFHAADPAIFGRRPWYGVDWAHAGACDSTFMAKWPAERRVWLPFEVLHLGPVACNWWGRATTRLDGREVEGADQARRRMAAMMARRRQRREAARFEGEKVGMVAAATMPPPEK
jgi:hypothetical protein